MTKNRVRGRETVFNEVVKTPPGAPRLAVPTVERVNRLARVLVLFALAPACGGGCGPEPGDEIPEDAAEQYAKAWCSALFQCDGCLVRTEHESEASCAAATQEKYTKLFEDFGKHQFHRECFDESLARLENGDLCDIEVFSMKYCELFTGKKEAGESCLDDQGSPAMTVDDCAEDLGCVGGICLRSPILVENVAELGEECTPKYSCIDGLRCSAGVCVAPVGEGATCANNECDKGLFCGGVCKPIAEDGEACESEGSAAGCSGTIVDGTGYASWCVGGMCSGAQPLFCSWEG